MNSFQKLWWQQAKSDHDVYVLLRKNGANPCHQLHYLQMATEKIGKAYFWREKKAPPQKHAFFAIFMKRLGGAPSRDQNKIANALKFRRYEDFQNWVYKTLTLTHDLEKLAPNLSQNGPNSEYPWPHKKPTMAPVNYAFPVWDKLINTAQGRSFIYKLGQIIDKFPIYA